MTKIKVNKALHASLSALLVLVLLVTSLPLTSMNTSAETVSQTKYDNITDFQKARWTQIQNAVFGQNFDTVQDTSVIDKLSVQSGNEFFNWTDTSKIKYTYKYKDAAGNVHSEERTGLSPYGTDTVTEVAEYKETRKTYVQTYVDYKGEKQTIESLAPEFHCYDVYTADQFVFLLEQMFKNRWWHTKINLCADIDMGGMQNKEYTTGRSLRNHLYIEGNGHTIYNWKMSGTSYYFGLFCSPQDTTQASLDCNNGSLVVKNLGIQSVMLLHQNSQIGAGAGLFFGGGTNCGAVLFDNVHMNQMLFQQTDPAVNKNNGQGIAFFGGRGAYRNNLLMNNCSTSNGYIYGKDHVGGMFSYTSTWCTLEARYNVDFPECPEAIAYAGYYPGSKFLPCPYPVYFNNSYSVDCEMFSTGYDSGMFVSCGGNIVARNCYTNNTMYSNSNTAGFIGRIHHLNQEMYDDNGNQTIGSYFKNCYTAGTVEGKVCMGGFTGLDNGYRPANDPCVLDYRSLISNSSNGTTVYSDCYSTTMVGMDYTGKYCGGFIGFDDSYVEKGTSVTASDGQKIDNIYGSVYMNCYAAGEVGNVMTVSDTDKAVEYDEKFNSKFDTGYCNRDVDMENPLYYPTGGFIGTITPDVYYRLDYTYGAGADVTLHKKNTYGYFYNCYYDMQTSGMREMAIGLAYAETCRDDPTGNNKRQGLSETEKTIHKDAEGNEMPFSVIGITGVYTEKSDVKNVAGLTGSPIEYKDGSGNVLSRMSMSGEGAVKEDDSNWQYNDGYYPQLKVFMSSDTTVGNINDTQVSDVTNDVKSSVFYVGEAEEVTETKEDGNVYITK
ncbi:MAG: hypothetical protein MRZ25_03030, partial [Ruminococcus sp.]|nr:hypothetical protein [Ruminococcus sp.]